MCPIVYQCPQFRHSLIRQITQSVTRRGSLLHPSLDTQHCRRAAHISVNLSQRLFPVPKRSGNDLLIIECNSTKLAADGMDLGTAFARLTKNDFARALLPNKRIVLVKTSTEYKLMRDLAETFYEHGRFRSILIVGHSNEAGLELTNAPVLCGWGALGKWLKPFKPEFIFLVACDAGRSAAVRQLFEPLKKSLRDVYASPVKLNPIQAAPLAVIIGELLCTGKIDDGNSLTARLVSYMNTGGPIYRWSYDETGP
jgi:hypothetical protein